MPRPLFFNRRKFLKTSAALGALVGGGGLIGAPAIAQANRPTLTHGVQSGNIDAISGTVWSRADQPATMLTDWATTDSFADAHHIFGPDALAETGYTAKQALADLPPGQDIFYRITFQSLDDPSVFSEPTVGHFRTAPATRQDIRFVWSGDTAGQGWGIDTDRGGMRGYQAMLDVEPDFFIHSGDTVYCDNPIEAEVTLDDGTIWRNVTTPEKSKVAETMAEFRGNFLYNMLDDNVRAFNQAVPMFAQWDDHEVVNNWYPGEQLVNDDRYTVKSVSLLAARANRAFRQCVPIRENPADPRRIYRKISRGPSLDIFFLDMRSYRGPNGANDQEEPSAETAFLGAKQIRWLKQELLASNATWKVIASDMPIGLVVFDNWRDRDTFENSANGDGPVRGREFDIADLLSFINRNNITNTVWLTADVHYTAAHYYDPNQAQFQDFAPFWEFVSGPIHAGTFGPNELDNTFGPQVVFQSTPPEGQFNLPPSAGLQFFGQVDIDGDTDVMTVSLKNIAGETLYSTDLNPA
ncbi:MAG: alkaline phosphatase D family protein [Pseudomonadota bacterium]